MAKLTEHVPRICKRLDETFRGPQAFSANHGNGSPSYAFRCPTCGREGRFNTNYLGHARVVTCNGLKFDRQLLDLHLAVNDHDAQARTQNTPDSERRMDDMTDGQIKYMVNRFLMWRLPENFRPDAGISFKPTFNDHMDPPMKHNPVGTNLFDADQAEAMVRYMIDGMDA